MLQLRIAVLDKRIIDGTFTEFDSKTYLSWINSMRRMLSTLGLQPPEHWNGSGKNLNLKDVGDAA
jgi:hypothetical protein